MVKSLSIVAAVFIFLGGMSGCVSSGPEFTWYHPQGGEYLFAFDAGQCETNTLGAGKELGTDPAGPFFTCMHELGYYLVDANSGEVLVPPSREPLAQSASTP